MPSFLASDVPEYPAIRIFHGERDDGYPIHYSAVKRGTPMYASDWEQVGKVDEVVDNYREHILDGIVIETTDGELRFVDAPEGGEDQRASGLAHD